VVAPQVNPDKTGAHRVAALLFKQRNPAPQPQAVPVSRRGFEVRSCSHVSPLMRTGGGHSVDVHGYAAALCMTAGGVWHVQAQRFADANGLGQPVAGMYFYVVHDPRAGEE